MLRNGPQKMRKREVKARTLPRCHCAFCMQTRMTRCAASAAGLGLGLRLRLRDQLLSDVRLFIREVFKVSYEHVHVGGIYKVTRSLRFSVSVTKTQLIHLFKVGLAQLFERMIKIELSS